MPSTLSSKTLALFFHLALFDLALIGVFLECGASLADEIHI